MSITQVFRCNQCNVAHQLKIRNPDSSANFNFVCRKCGNKIAGTYSSKQFELTNASIDTKEENEPAYLHEPENI